MHRQATVGRLVTTLAVAALTATVGIMFVTANFGSAAVLAAEHGSGQVAAGARSQATQIAAVQSSSRAASGKRRDPGVRRIAYYGYANAIELKNADTRVVIAPQAGGRVLEYSLHGKTALYLSDAEKAWKPGKPPQSSAGRFDIGPELVIPRHPALWSGDWTAEVTGPRACRLTSPRDDATGVQLVRDFVLDAKSSRLLCTQTIRNVSDHVTEWCHWSRTFATGEGICLIPLTSPSRFPNKYVMYEEGSLVNARPQDENIRERDGFLEILGPPRKPKLGFDSYAGWMAYLTTDGLLFVKKFKTYPDRVYNEVAGLTISVWYPPGPRVELEPIGPRERLQPGESASFTEEWWLLPQPFPADRRSLKLKELRRRVLRETAGASQSEPPAKPTAANQ